MKLVPCHNFYQQPGGEDQVFADETRLLRAAGPATLLSPALHPWRIGPWRRTGGTAVPLIVAATDNALVYNLLFTDSLFALMGAAYGTFHESQQRAV